MPVAPRPEVTAAADHDQPALEGDGGRVGVAIGTQVHPGQVGRLEPAHPGQRQRRVGAASDHFAAGGATNPLQLALYTLTPFYVIAIGLFLWLARTLHRQESRI